MARELGKVIILCSGKRSQKKGWLFFFFIPVLSTEISMWNHGRTPWSYIRDIFFIRHTVTHTSLVFVSIKARIRFLLSDKNCFLHRLIQSNVSVLIIEHARSPRHFTHSTSLTCLHYYLKGNTTWISRVSSGAANQKAQQKPKERCFKSSARKSDMCRRVNKYYHF